MKSHMTEAPRCKPIEIESEGEELLRWQTKAKK